jgi:hypothetical protein
MPPGNPGCEKFYGSNDDIRFGGKYFYYFTHSEKEKRDTLHSEQFGEQNVANFYRESKLSNRHTCIYTNNEKDSTIAMGNTTTTFEKSGAHLAR